MKTNFIERRSILFSTAVGVLSAKCEALALSLQPPSIEEIVPISHLVLIGSVQRYVFRGILKLERPEEYRIDFEDDEGQRGRAMDAIVHIDKVLLGKIATQVQKVVRVHWPISREKRSTILGDRKIFFLREPSLYKSSEGILQNLYGNLTLPRPTSDLQQVLEAVKKFNETRKKN